MNISPLSNSYQIPHSPCTEDELMKMRETFNDATDEAAKLLPGYSWKSLRYLALTFASLYGGHLKAAGINFLSLYYNLCQGMKVWGSYEATKQRLLEEVVGEAQEQMKERFKCLEFLQEKKFSEKEIEALKNFGDLDSKDKEALLIILVKCNGWEWKGWMAKLHDNPNLLKLIGIDLNQVDLKYHDLNFGMLFSDPSLINNSLATIIEMPQINFPNAWDWRSDFLHDNMYLDIETGWLRYDNTRIL